MRKRTETLAARVEALRAELVELDSVEEPTDEQVARSTEALAEYDTAKAEYDAARAHDEKIESIRTAVVDQKVERGFEAPNVSVRKDPWDGIDSLRHMDPNSTEVLDRARFGIEGTKLRGMADEAKDRAIDTVETVPGAARLSLAVGSPAYYSAFNEFMRSSGNPQYTAEEAAAVRASMSLTSANGGYALPFLLDPTVIHTGTATSNPVRQLARVERGTQNVWHGVSSGNVTTYWKGEGSAFTDGSPTIAGPTVTAAMLTAYVTASFELFQDQPAWQAELGGLIGEAFDFKEGTAFITGSGSTAPKGIVTAVSGTAGSLVTCTTRGSFTSASSADVFAVVNAAAVRYENSSVWLANKAILNVIRQMGSTAQGSLFWTDFAGPQTPPTLLGYPVYPSSDVASAQTSGTIIGIFGDLRRGFLVYDRIGTSVEFISNVVDGSGLPTGQRGLVAYKRVGSDVLDVDAVRLLKT